MKMIFWGHNNYGCFVLKYFIRKGYSIPLVITPSNDENKLFQLKSILGEAARIISILNFSEDELIEMVHEINPNVMLSCSFKYKIPSSLIQIKNLKIINIHGAILPHYRGANMLNWVIIKGCNESGITLHYMDETLDTGDILASIKYPINANEDANIIKNRMFEYTIKLFDENWEEIINNRCRIIKQDHSKGYYFPARKPEDGLINWHSNAKDINNLIRALVKPFPGAFSFYEGIYFRFEKAEILIDNKVHFKPGKIIKSDKNYIIVTSIYNLLKVTEIYDENSHKIKNLTQFKLNTFFKND